MRKSVALIAVLLAVAVVGCGEPRHLGAGTVQFADGEPVRGGGVELRPVAGGERYAGKINRDGGFQLQSSDGTLGLPPGEYEAVVVLIVITEDLPAHMHDHGRNVPPRYGDYHTSDLRHTIASVEDGPIELVIETE